MDTRHEPWAGVARGICELTLETPDAPRLERFYRDVLGCEVISHQHDRIWLSCGPHARLGIWSPGKKASSRCGTSSSMAKAPVTASAR